MLNLKKYNIIQKNTYTSTKILYMRAFIIITSILVYVQSQPSLRITLNDPIINANTTYNITIQDDILTNSTGNITIGFPN